MSTTTISGTGCEVSTSHITGDVVCQKPGRYCDCLVKAADAPPWREAHVYSNWGSRTITERREAVANYMPGNYGVYGDGVDRDGREYIVIGGNDDCGWTMEDYIIPRLASGLYFAEEVDLDA